MQLFVKEAGQGSPLVIVHGLFGSGDNWATLAKQFAHHYRVITVDMRNHGHSPHNPEMNYEVMAHDLFETLAHIGVRDVNLIGHSMGGKVVMRFAQLYPFLVHKLIVADISPRYYPTHHGHILEALQSLDFRSVKSRAEVAQILHEKLHDPGTEQFLLKGLYWIHEGQLGLRYNVAAIARHIERIGEALPEIPVAQDTLFVRGDRSHYIPDEDWSAILQLFPHAQLLTVENAGHWLQADQPVAFAEAVLGFLAT
jgi:pimeloyl-ACP methyl ester carboxylesterase